MAKSFPIVVEVEEDAWERVYDNPLFSGQGLAAWNRFLSERYAEVKAEHPAMSHGDRMRHIGAAWRKSKSAAKASLVAV